MRRVLFPVLIVSAAALIYVTLRNEAPVTDAAVSRPAEPGAVLPESATTSPPGNDPQPAADNVAPRPATGSGAKVDELRGFSPDDLKALAEHGDAFLARRGDTAYNRLAVFSATGDRRVLEQALERFPKDPALLYVALADAPKEERAGLIERFKSADPNNPLPWLFSAAEQFENGLVENALEDVREALKRPGFYTYFNERAAALRELALQSGAGEFAAESLALFSQTLPHLQAATRVARGLEAWAQAQSVGGDRGIMRDASVLMFDLGRMFQTPEASRLLVGQLVGVSLEQRALNLIPSSDDNPLPVKYDQRTGELAQIRDEAKALGQQAGRVIAEPALWKGYFERFRADGEMSALRWVQQQAPTKQIPVPAAVGAMLEN